MGFLELYVCTINFFQWLSDGLYNFYCHGKDDMISWISVFYFLSYKSYKAYNGIYNEHTDDLILMLCLLILQLTIINFSDIGKVVIQVLLAKFAHKDNQQLKSKIENDDGNME